MMQASEGANMKGDWGGKNEPKLRLEWFNYPENLIKACVKGVKIGGFEFAFEFVMTYEMALRYILHLRINSTEPRTRKLEN